jgi:hypothetical protein
MAHATHEDMTVLRRCVLDDNFREALDKAPPASSGGRSVGSGHLPAPSNCHRGGIAVSRLRLAHTCACRIGNVVDPRLRFLSVGKLRVADTRHERPAQYNQREHQRAVDHDR